ncbi:MAG: hypothetical protein WCO06_00705 [Candidatus Roizmanbacteria bacterium]
MKHKKAKNLFFISLICLAVIFFFKSAFSINFFLDDFFFLKVGHASTIIEFLQFFNPNKDYFYRPIPTEVFYYILGLAHYNLFFAHSLVFCIYFVGLVYLFKSIYLVTKNKLFSYLSVFLFSIHLTRVFQLYQLATFIEIALFSFLTISFFYYLKNKYIVSSIFFILALMSKETAVLFPLLLCTYELTKHYIENHKITFNIKLLKSNKARIGMMYGLFALFFVVLYKLGVSNVTTIDTYRIQLNSRLILNNSMWYTLWVFGFPNFLPVYMTSIFSPPLPEFWKILKTHEASMYFYSLLLFYSLFIPTFFLMIWYKRKEIINHILLIVVFLFLHLLFIAPTLPIIHRWMVRLTVPSVFISILQAMVIYFAIKKSAVTRGIAVCLIILYISYNFYGIKVHESSSLFFLESRIVSNATTYFSNHNDSIQNRNNIYFLETKPSSWGGSKKLKVSLHDQSFLNYYFPQKQMKVIYESDSIPAPILLPNTYVVESDDIIEGRN